MRRGNEIYQEKSPKQDNRSELAQSYFLRRSKTTAPMSVKETEPSKLTMTSALKDNSLNAIRNSVSRIVRVSTTSLLMSWGRYLMTRKGIGFSFYFRKQTKVSAPGLCSACAEQFFNSIKKPAILHDLAKIPPFTQIFLVRQIAFRLLRLMPLLCLEAAYETKL